MKENSSDIPLFVREFNKKNSSSPKKNSSENNEKVISNRVVKQERVINVQKNGFGLCVTTQNESRQVKTRYYESIEKCKRDIFSKNIEIGKKWYNYILRISLDTTKTYSPKNSHSKKTKKTKKETNPQPQYTVKEKTYQERLHISIAEDIKKHKVAIKIYDDVFNCFSDAIRYVESRTSDPEMFRHLQVEFLCKKREKWEKQIWTKRIYEILKHETVTLLDLCSKMQCLDDSSLSEEDVRRIMGLCKNFATEKVIDGVCYYSLLDNPLEPLKPKARVIQDVPDNCEAFKNDYFELLNQPISGNPEDIYIGLDFGTSFTKCAYQYDINNREVFTFGESPFKSTVVYLTDDGRLSFFKPETEHKQIQFFKATIIKDKSQYSLLRYTDLSLPNHEIQETFEMLCSAFFIANIICFIKHKLNNMFHISPDLQIAMGVPLFNNYDNQIIYNKALHCGIHIAEKVENPSTISLSSLYDLYLSSEITFNNDLYSAYPNRISHCTIPELFTEALYLLNRTDYMPGNYYVIDIGGGTADFAFIVKEEARIGSFDVKSFNYHCPQAVVANLGNEVRKACESDINEFKKYIEEFGKVYSTTVFKSKAGLENHDHMKVRQLLFGGGSVDPSRFYQNMPFKFQDGLSGVFCEIIENTSDEITNSFIPQKLNLSQEDKQRLIIATQLAIPYTSDAFLMSRPENYDPTPVILRKKRDIEDNSPGYDSVG